MYPARRDQVAIRDDLRFSCDISRMELAKWNKVLAIPWDHTGDDPYDIDHKHTLLYDAIADDLVMPKDNRLTRSQAWAALRRLRDRHRGNAELSDLLAGFHPHVARHTVATSLLSSGSDVRTVQEVLGHVSMETLKVYTEITDEGKRAAYKKLEEYLTPHKTKVPSR